MKFLSLIVLFVSSLAYGDLWGGTSSVTDSMSCVQSTSPWVDNISQFGGTNLSTGTGTGGAGIPRVTVSSDSSLTANAGTNLNTSLLALDSTVAKDSSLSTINTSVNTLLKPASTLSAVTTLGSITSALPTGTNSIGQVTSNAGTNLNTSALNLETTQSGFKSANHTDLALVDTDLLSFKSANHTDLIGTQPRNLAQVNGVTVSTGTGASGTGTQRVTLAADGQKTMANSTSVTLASDQTGMNTALDKSGSGTISALNGSVTATTNGASACAFGTSGTWVGTLFFKGQRQDGTFEYLFANSIAFGTDISSQSYTTNGTYLVNCAGFSSVQIKAEAYTSGTINVGWNTSGGVHNVKIYQPTAGSLQMTANAGVNLNTSALALSSTQTDGTQKTKLVDGSGNVATTTTISGTAANKQPVDVNNLSTATTRYYTSFSIQQSAATGANATVFSMRNAASATKTALIENVYCREGFNASNPITRTQQTYIFQRFTTATPTGGTALTAGLGDSSDAASQVTDIRFLDTGLTTTSVAFVANNLGTMACDTTQGVTCQASILNPPGAWRLAPGEGLAVRLGVAAVTGVSISCSLGWREQ